MTFQEGDPALLIDNKGRHFLLRLEAGKEFRYHLGSVPHDALIGSEDGAWITSSGGSSMLLISPRLSDFVLKMKRGAQIVYPKDLGALLVYGDIAPGETVVEAGTGSGALTLGLIRAVGESGRVVSVDIREDHLKHARKTIERFFGGLPANLELRVDDVTSAVEEVKPNRIVLDLPEPWHAIEAAAKYQPAGGVLSAYLPTVPQVQKTVDTARDSGMFAEVEVREVMQRDWNVAGRSVRPEHSMVGHTGFLVFMRKTGRRPESGNPEK